MAEKYIAKKDCFGYRDSFWAKGSEVVAEAGDVPPPPFELVEKPAKHKKTSEGEKGGEKE